MTDFRLRYDQYVRVLCISDIHDEFERFPVDRMRDAHVALVAGDLTNFGTQHGRTINRATKWMRELAARFRIVAYVGGNHDFGIDNDTFAVRDGLGGSCIGIERRAEEIGWSIPIAPYDPANPLQQTASITSITWLRIYGASLSPCFDAPALAQQWCRMTADPSEDRSEWARVPPADIIVSHCPPEGILDSVWSHLPLGENLTIAWGARHIGSPGLRSYLKRDVQIPGHKFPRLVVCGHVHEAAGVERLQHHRDGEPVGETVIVNCARRAVYVEIPREGRIEVLE